MKVAVILGSTRDGRMGERVAKLVVSEAEKMQDWNVELIDLKALNLPIYNDAMPTGGMQGKYTDPIVSKWGEKIASADAFIFITPEYNHSIPAPLKNAIDSLYPEWENKAGGIVSYSMSPYGGARAVEHLRGILGHMGIATVQTSVSISSVHETVSDDGKALKEGIANAIQTELSQIDLWGRALLGVKKLPID